MSILFKHMLSHNQIVIDTVLNRENIGAILNNEPDHLSEKFNQFVVLYKNKYILNDITEEQAESVKQLNEMFVLFNDMVDTKLSVELLPTLTANVPKEDSYNYLLVRID